MAKFASLDEQGNGVNHDYGNRYFRQPCGSSQRLVIGASSANIKLLDELATAFATQQFYILYVLLLSHAGRSPGRYQSPPIASHEDLQLFIWTFQNFFEGDGRHHIWIGSPQSSDLLVYDQHDVIFAYGNLDGFEALLINHGFTQQQFWFPCPHSHSFDPANVNAEDELMAYFDWVYYELQEGDEWD
jgi:hypothetical protein